MPLAEEGVLDFIYHRARPIAADKPLCLIQPANGFTLSNPHPDVSPMAGQVQGNLRFITGIGSEGCVAPVKRTIEIFRSIFNHKIPAVGPITERPGRMAFHRRPFRQKTLRRIIDVGRIFAKPFRQTCKQTA